MISAEKDSVAIVGIGPVGLVLAIDLARQGAFGTVRHRVRVAIDKPGNLHFSAQSGIFRRIGELPGFREKALH